MSSEQERSSGIHRIAESTRETGQQARQRMRTLAERASEKWHSTLGSAHDARQRASGKAQQMRQRYHETRERSAQTIREHPFAAAGVALGLGMLLGFAMRESRREERMFGEQARAAGQRMREAGRETVERGEAMAERTWESTKEAAEREGLTPEGLREQAEEATGTRPSGERPSQHQRESGEPTEGWGRQE